MPEGVLNQLILRYSPLLYCECFKFTKYQERPTTIPKYCINSISSINSVLFSKLWQNLLFTNLYCLLTMASLSSKPEIPPLLYYLFSSYFITEFL